jgi:hypothetical protein
MTRKNRSGWLGWALVVGGVIGFVASRRRFERPRIRHLGAWQRSLAGTRGEAEAARLAARVQARFEKLYAERPRFAQRALRDHFENSILPSLALYQVLREELEQEAALAEVDRLFENSFGQPAKFMPYLGYLPNPFELLRLLGRLSLQNNFPPQGWELEWVEDSEQTFAFNMHTCFYLNVLTAYDAPELTPACCRVDDLMFEALPASVRWERTKTLGRGDDCCDFCWRQNSLRPYPGFSRLFADS